MSRLRKYFVAVGLALGLGVVALPAAAVVPSATQPVVPLNCVEAEALSDLLNTIGYRAAAASWIVKHSETDEPDEKEAHA